jgi:hypothetical protein
MSEVGFEPTIPAFERVKKVALDRAATVIGLPHFNNFSDLGLLTHLLTLRI